MVGGKDKADVFYTDKFDYMLEVYNHEKKILDDKIIQLVKENADPKDFSLLKSIVGISDYTASVILIYYDSFRRFNTIRKVIKYSGLKVILKQSGKTKDYVAGISKRGPKMLRKALYMSAWSASKHNPSCAHLFKRVKAKNESGKRGNIPMCAVAAKLLRQAYGVLKSRRPFDRNYVSIDMHTQNRLI